MKNIFLGVGLTAFSCSVFAEAVSTGKTKVEFTQGHINPKCRIVGVESNASGSQKLFRISEVEGNDDISSVILAALMSERDIDIRYDPNQTSGCGSEPKILYVTVY